MKLLIVIVVLAALFALVWLVSRRYMRLSPGANRFHEHRGEASAHADPGPDRGGMVG